MASDRFGVFISYSFEIESLARKLKDKLQVLDDENKLDVFVASELGGKKWRQEIDRRLGGDHILLLPYPHQAMKLDWVCYELGAFHRKGTPICIMNTNLKGPPDQICDWKAYKAEAGDLRRFFVSLFESGDFTDGKPINPKLSTEPEFRQRLREAIAEIETEFAAFRLEEKFFARRIKIVAPANSSSTGAKLPAKLNFENAQILGSDETLALFGVQSGVSWAKFKAACSAFSSTVWLEEIEGMLQVQRDKLLAHTLTPFRMNKVRAFIPVVSRIESIEDIPSKLSVLFIELTGETRIAPDISGNYDAMPSNWGVLFLLLDVARRFRWDVLEPVRSALRHEFKYEPVQKWGIEARRVLDATRTLQRELAAIGMKGEAQFYSAFEQDIKNSLIEKMADYPVVEKAYATAIDEGSLDRTLLELDRISLVNAVFFEHTVRQLHLLVADLR